MALAVATASPVQAAFFTEQSTVQVQSLVPPAGPISPAILIETGAGRTFTNTYGLDRSGDALVRSVGVIVINDVKTGPNGGQTFSAIVDPAAPTHALVVAFALDGHTTGPGSPTVQFTSGGAGVWQAPTNLNTDDASTWFSNFSNPIYQTVLSTPQDIFIGNGDTLGGHNPGDLAIPAPLVNLSSINAANPTLIQGTLLFNEPFPQNFINTNTPNSGIDSILAIANQTIGNQTSASNLLNADTPGGGTAAQKQSVVNALAAFFGLSNLGGPNTAFATFGSGTSTDYRPGGPGPLDAGDFSATATVELYSGAEIPEPSTFGLMAIGTAAIGLFAGFRSNRKS